MIRDLLKGDCLLQSLGIHVALTLQYNYAMVSFITFPLQLNAKTNVLTVPCAARGNTTIQYVHCIAPIHHVVMQMKLVISI